MRARRTVCWAPYPPFLGRALCEHRRSSNSIPFSPFFPPDDGQRKHLSGVARWDSTARDILTRPPRARRDALLSQTRAFGGRALREQGVSSGHPTSSLHRQMLLHHIRAQLITLARCRHRPPLPHTFPSSRSSSGFDKIARAIAIGSFVISAPLNVICPELAGVLA
jgi:hypothetical protein